MITIYIWGIVIYMSTWHSGRERFFGATIFSPCYYSIVSFTINIKMNFIGSIFNIKQFYETFFIFQIIFS